MCSLYFPRIKYSNENVYVYVYVYKGVQMLTSKYAALA